MTVNKTNRSHRTAYMVVMLALAVALTTALVLAGEKNSDSQKKNVFQQNLHKTFSVELQKGAGRCVAA